MQGVCPAYLTSNKGICRKLFWMLYNLRLSCKGSFDGVVQGVAKCHQDRYLHMWELWENLQLAVKDKGLDPMRFDVLDTPDGQKYLG